MHTYKMSQVVKVTSKTWSCEKGAFPEQHEFIGGKDDREGGKCSYFARK